MLPWIVPIAGSKGKSILEKEVNAFYVLLGAVLLLGVLQGFEIHTGLVVYNKAGDVVKFLKDVNKTFDLNVSGIRKEYTCITKDGTVIFGDYSLVERGLVQLPKNANCKIETKIDEDDILEAFIKKILGNYSEYVDDIDIVSGLCKSVIVSIEILKDEKVDPSIRYMIIDKIIEELINKNICKCIQYNIFYFDNIIEAKLVCGREDIDCRCFEYWWHYGQFYRHK